MSVQILPILSATGVTEVGYQERTSQLLASQGHYSTEDYAPIQTQHVLARDILHPEIDMKFTQSDLSLSPQLLQADITDAGLDYLHGHLLLPRADGRVPLYPQYHFILIFSNVFIFAFNFSSVSDKVGLICMIRVLLSKCSTVMGGYSEYSGPHIPLPETKLDVAKREVAYAYVYSGTAPLTAIR